MIAIKTDKILLSEAEIIVNPVNCQGLLFGNLSKRLRLQYPEYETAYKAICASRCLKGGEYFLYNIDKDRSILSIAIQDNETDLFNFYYFESAIDKLIKVIDDKAVKSIAFPFFVGDIKGADWEIIYSKLATLDTILDQFIIYIYLF